MNVLTSVLLQDSYIQSRADTMQNIESTIVELGSIFQQLAHMVKEQEETIQRWDGDTRMVYGIIGYKQQTTNRRELISVTNVWLILNGFVFF